MKTFVVIDDSHDFIEALRILWQEIEKPRHSEWEAQFLCFRQSDSQQNIDNSPRMWLIQIIYYWTAR